MRYTRHLVLLCFGLLAATACEDQSYAPTSSMEATLQAGRNVPKPACDVVVPDDHPTIQAAVDAADPGGTLCVMAGTYTEQVVIGKDLILVGYDQPVVQAPAAPATYTIAESGATWQPVIFAFGGTESSGAVSGPEVSKISIKGLVIDGSDRNPTSERSSGILARNVEGGIADNVVRNMHVGDRQTFGIIAYGDSDLRIQRNEVSEYERGGIGANGDGGPLPDPVAHIADNDVTGSTGIEEAWAPNGIQIGFGASGSITGNTVRDNRWAGSDWAASCILVFESDGIQIQRNTVENCDAGIGVEAWGWFLPSADNAKIDRNSISEAWYGIAARAVSLPGYSGTDPSASNNKAVGNDLDGGSLGAIGILVAEYDLDPTYDATATNNKLINNDIDGFDTPIYDGGTDSKVHANGPATP